MTGSPLVSIVVLNYNYARYLPQCLDSVLAQDYRHTEVIVVDDGSTDDSLQILAAYGERVSVCVKANGGMVSSMNRGYALSQGSIVVFVDADDFLLHDAVSIHVAALRDPAVVRSQIYMTVLHGSEVSNDEIPARTAPAGDLRDLVLRRGPGAYISAPTTGNAWTRRFLDQVMPLPEQPRTIGADTYLMDAAPLFGTVAVLRRPAKAAYRIHDTNMSGAIAPMTERNIRRIITHFDARTEWLTAIATRHGLRPDSSEWLARNWRLLTLRYLQARIAGEERVSLLAHLRPTREVEGPAVKGHIIAAAIVLIHVLPLPLAMLVARRVINLRLM